MEIKLIKTISNIYSIYQADLIFKDAIVENKCKDRDLIKLMYLFSSTLSLESYFQMAEQSSFYGV